MIKRKFKQYRGYECLNCEIPIDPSEKYCHHCGQLNSTKKLTISDFIDEFLSNFYAYDSRLRNSILSIFSKPGILAKEFNEGKRQKYANPFRLFLSVSLLLFITIGINEKMKSKPIQNDEKFNLVEEINKQDTVHLNIAGNKSDLLINEQLGFNRTFHKDSIYNKSELNKNAFGIFYRVSSFRNYNIKHPNKTEKEALTDLGFSNTRLNRFLYNKSKLFKSNNIKDELAIYFNQKLPFLIFLSLPIITIIFWLLYYSRKLNYTEHLIFCYTFFTFIFICMLVFYSIGLISETISEILIGFSLLLVFPIYFYKSLRNFYEEKRWKTILKFILLIPLFGLFLTISILIMIALGIILF